MALKNILTKITKTEIILFYVYLKFEKNIIINSISENLSGSLHRSFWSSRLHARLKAWALLENK
jgi:hypothetical protein